MKLNLKQKQIHERAVAAAAKFQKAESGMIEVLQEADRVRLHKSFGLSSLLKYATKHLKLSEPIALAFIAVARKSIEVPALKVAIVEGQLSVSSASRLVSTINKENAVELIHFASTHSWRETEREIADRNPRAVRPDKFKMLGHGLVEITLTVTEDQLKEFERACSVEAQRTGAAPKRNEVFMATVRTHLDKYDPVRKAERARKRQEVALQKNCKPNRNPERTELATRSNSERTEPAAGENSVRTDSDVSENSKVSPANSVRTDRMPFTAAQLHTVHSRDQGCCTHVNTQGVRCNQDRWTQIHHIIPVSRGGTNDADNLTTLCSFHHDLAHQLTLPIEGQITWLRDRTISYRA